MIIESLKKLTRNSGQQNYIPNGYIVGNGQEVSGVNWYELLSAETIELLVAYDIMKPSGYSDYIISHYWN